MCEEMGLTHLQQILRSFCFKSEWKYAVFWKLKHRARMMLTWEDAYYANQETFDQSDQMAFNDNSLDNLRDGHCLQDTLGLAVAKMSYLVYSLGEGIIGQVAVTGKHQWIFADKPTSRCWSSSEYCDGWQTQFSAGIKTIAVVAVVPHGVVQLGSLHTIAEDVKLVTHIKDVFCSLQNSAMRYISYQIPYTTQSSSCLSEVSTKFSGSEVINNFPLSSDNVPRSQRKIDPQSYSLPLPGTSNDEPRDFHSLPGAHQKKAVEVVNEYVGDEKIEMRNHENTEFLHAQSVVLNSEKEKRGQKELSNKENCEEVNIGWRTLPVHPRLNNASIPCDHTSEKLDSFTCSLAEFVTYPSFPITVIDSADRGAIKFGGVAPPLKEELPLPKSFDMQINEAELSCIDTVSSSLKFSAGCELYEALGPCFKKQLESCSWDESERAEAKVIKPLERTASSLFIDCEPDYLLEAVVANSCILSSNAKGDSSLCKSAESLLTTGKTHETFNHVKHGSVLASKSSVHTALSAGDAHNNLKLMWDSTEGCNVRSSKDSSSKTISASSKHSEMQTEPSKGNRKRARPGESCRPRPRDRQLIQDRVKELRELVPNGSKCSIDSLLERTIKHMFFLQSVTKHADKLRKCAESKFRDNKRSLRGSFSHEHGSSWALDVGGQADVCPLVVENLNMDGQMLVEMLCEECGRFLEIAEAIRSLGLTILKGVTEARGENIWACFVVEGQNNRAMHRMDVLWSLMQLLQPKTTTG